MYQRHQHARAPLMDMFVHTRLLVLHSRQVKIFHDKCGCWRLGFWWKDTICASTWQWESKLAAVQQKRFLYKTAILAKNILNRCLYVKKNWIFLLLQAYTESSKMIICLKYMKNTSYYNRKQDFTIHPLPLWTTSPNHVDCIMKSHY